MRLRDLLWENRKRNYGDRKWANFVLFAKFLCANFITRFGNLAGSRSSKILMLLQQRSRKYMPSVSFSIDNRGNSWSKWMLYSGDASKISLVEDWMGAAHLAFECSKLLVNDVLIHLKNIDTLNNFTVTYGSFPQRY